MKRLFDRAKARLELLVIALGFCLLGCQTRPILLPGNAPCENACAVLAFFECPEAKPSPGGKSCEQVCEVASRYGTQAECVVRAESLEAVRACAVECRW